MSLTLIIVAIKWVAGTVIALLSTGGVIKLIEMRSNRPESQAKAKVQNVTAETTLGEGWRAYADKVEERFKTYEDGYKETIKGLEKKIDDERARHDLILERKDTEIVELKEANRILTVANGKLTETNEILREQNHILRNQLQAISPAAAEKVEEVKQSLHAHVEESIESLKPHDAPPEEGV